MKFLFAVRIRNLVLLGLLLSGAMAATAHGEGWNSWMTRGSGKETFESQLSMARLNERHGQEENARKIYQAVLAKQPNHQLAHHRMAVMAASSGNFELANRHFQSALQAGPPNAELLGDQGYSLFLQDRLDEAEKTLRQTLQQFPNYKPAHNSLGLVLGHKGRYDEALSEFRQVVGEAEAHANLAFVMSQAGHLEQASNHYHQALKLDQSLRPAAEALIQLHGHTPAESAILNSGTTLARNSSNAPMPAGGNSNATASASTPASVTSNPGVQSGGLSDFASTQTGLIAAQNNASQSSNALPEIAKVAGPPTPQLPAQNQASFSPLLNGLSQTKPAQAVSENQLVSNESMAVDETQPAVYEVTPAARIQAQVFDTPVPQVVVGGMNQEALETPAQGFAPPAPQLIAAAKLHADQLSHAAGLDHVPGSYDLQSAASVESAEEFPVQPIESKMQTETSYCSPVSFIAVSKAATSSMESKSIASESSNAAKQPASQVGSGASVGTMALVSLGSMLGLVTIGGAVWLLKNRKKPACNLVSTLPGCPSSHEEKNESFNMEETYTYLENQIRDVWEGRSLTGSRFTAGGSARSYYR